MINTITNNIRIRKKLFLSYLIVVFLPVIAVGLLLTNSLREQSVSHAVTQATNNVEKIKKQVEEILKTPYDISNTIYFDKQLKAIVGQKYISDLEVYHAYREYTNFTDFKELYKEIAGIRFYTNNHTLLDNWSIFKISDNEQSLPWFQQAMNNRGRIGWYYIADPTKKNSKYISLVRQIYGTNMSLSGILVITINPLMLQNIISQEPYDTMILTDQEEIIAAKDESIIGSTLEQLRLKDSFGRESIEAESMKYQGNSVKIISHTITLDNSDNTLRILSIIPFESILKEAERISRIAYIIICSSLLLSMLLILYFSGTLSKRIQILSQDIRKVAMGDFTRRSVVEGKDEVGQLSRHFNFMVENMDDLITRVKDGHRRQYELELKQDQMKFKMLANQVNPHFLFNVLETIRMKAHCQNEHEIANTVKALGNLLRHSLEMGQDPVQLASEMEVVRMYLEIQRFRFGEKLTYDLPRQEDMEGIFILPMLLQPIVENAVVHGTENKMGKGYISVSIKRMKDSIAIKISDNGDGMLPSKIEEITRMMNVHDEEVGMRIGLRNVHHRIQLLHGVGYGLRIESEEKKGTTVNIILPIGDGSHV